MSTFPLEKMTSDASLLVIDLQERFIPAMPESRIDRVIRSAEILVELAQHVGIPISYTEQYPRGLGSTVSSLKAKLEEASAYRVEKTHFDACGEAAFEGALELLGPRVFVIGIEAHICVRATVHSLRTRGIEVFVPHDAVASRRDEDRAIGLERMRDAGALITTTESVVFDTLKCAHGERFKRFSKMVR